MRLSIEFVFRIIGAIVFAIGAGFLGNNFANFLAVVPDAYVAVFSLIGLLFGLILTPSLTIRPLRQLSGNLANMPPERLIAIISGIFLGLMAAALLSLPLGFLPAPFRQIMPLATAVVLCYLSVIILTSRQKDLLEFFS